MRLSLCLLVALYFVPSLGSAVAGPALTAAELADLAAATSEKVPEIARARAIARESQARVALYGGTSRELLAFVRDKAVRLGGADAYRAWLQTRPTIKMLDWHRVFSDLDFMLIPNEGTTGLTDARLKELRGLQSHINERFPNNAFFTKFDVMLAPDFFEKYPPFAEHFEAISNLAITERGLEKMPQLVGSVNGHRTDLAEWGIEQLARGELDFAKLPAGASRNGAVEDLRQVLRWIRYLSEYPELRPTPRAIAAIRELLAETVERHPVEVLRLFGQEKKIQDALEKLQIYSKNSGRTRELLDQFGITELAQKAGIARARIYEPLAEGAPVGGTGKRLGREVTLNHRTTLAAAQNISQGALWQSNNLSQIQGKQTVAAYGKGLYAAEGAEALGYGDIYVKLVLSPDAIEWVDFDRHGDYWIIKTAHALARNPDGSLKIERITQDSIVRNQLARFEELRNTGGLMEHAYEMQSIFRSLGAVLNPLQDGHDAATFEKVLQAAQTYRGLVSGGGLNEALLESVIVRPELFQAALRENSPGALRLRRWILDAVESRGLALHVLEYLGERLGVPESDGQAELLKRFLGKSPAEQALFFPGWLKDPKAVGWMLSSRTSLAGEVLRAVEKLADPADGGRYVDRRVAQSLGRGLRPLGDPSHAAAFWRWHDKMSPAARAALTEGYLSAPGELGRIFEAAAGGAGLGGTGAEPALKLRRLALEAEPSRVAASFAADPAALRKLGEAMPEQWISVMNEIVARHPYSPEMLDPRDVVDRSFLKRLLRNAKPGKPFPHVRFLGPEQQEYLRRVYPELYRELAETTFAVSRYPNFRLQPENPRDLQLLEKILNAEPTAKLGIKGIPNWLESEVFDDEAIRFLRERRPDLWRRVVYQSMLAGHPTGLRARTSVYMLDPASTADAEGVRDYIQALTGKKRAGMPSFEKSLRDNLRNLAQDRRFEGLIAEAIRAAPFRGERVHWIKQLQQDHLERPEIFEAIQAAAVRKAKTPGEYREAFSTYYLGSGRDASPEAREKAAELIRRSAAENLDRYTRIASPRDLEQLGREFPIDQLRQLRDELKQAARCRKGFGALARKKSPSP